MENALTPKKAQEIISKCEQMETWAKKIQSYSTSVKAEMRAFKGGVGTALNKRAKKSSNIKADKIKSIREKFYK